MKRGFDSLFVFWGGLALLVLMVVISIADGSIREFYFSADNLYIATLFEDLTRWGGSLSDWHCPPSPYFFPDLLLYGIARLLTGSTVMAVYLSGTVQFLLIVVAGREALRRALPQCSAGASVIAPVFVIWFATSRLQWLGMIAAILVINVHGGAVLVHFVTLAVCLTSAPGSFVVTAIVCVLAGLTGFSDPLYVAGTVPPLIVFAATASLSKLPSTQRFVEAFPAAPLRCALVSIAGVLGTLCARQLFGGDTVSYTTANLDKSVSTFHKFLTTSDSNTWRVVGFLFASTMIGLLAIVRERDRGTRNGLLALVLWQAASTFATLFAMFATSMFVDSGSLRYLNIPLHVTLVLLSAVLIQQLARVSAARHASRLWRVASAFTILGFVIASVSHASSLFSGQYQPARQATARCLVGLANREGGVSTILSEYWQAKSLTLLSGRRIEVLQVDDNIQPRLWINSKGWYRGEHHFGLVAATGLNLKHLRRRFGPPQAVDRCDDLEIWIYRAEARQRMSSYLQSRFNEFAGPGN